MAAELTDEQIDAARDAFDWDGWIEPKNAQRAFVREILALATQQATQGAEPAGYFLRDGFSPAGDGTKRWQQVADEYAGDPDVVALYTAPPPTKEVDGYAKDRAIMAAVLEAHGDCPHSTGTSNWAHWVGSRVLAALQSDQAQAGTGDGHDQ